MSDTDDPVVGLLDSSELAAIAEPSGSLRMPTDGLLPEDTPLSLVSAVSGGFQTAKAASLEIDQRVGDCMHESGLDHFPLVIEQTTWSDDYATIGQWHEQVRQIGYDIYYSSTEAGIKERQDHFDMFQSIEMPEVDMDDEYWIALIGRPDGVWEEVDASPATRLDELGDGCLRRAVESFREEHALPELTDALYSVLYRVDYATSADFQAAFDDWVQCMADAGIEAIDMSNRYAQIEDEFFRGVGLQSPEETQQQFEREREIAIAHVECEWQHTLAARLALEYDHLQGLVESHPELARFLTIAEERLP